jgi:hypothetical protein
VLDKMEAGERDEFVGDDAELVAMVAEVSPSLPPLPLPSLSSWTHRRRGWPAWACYPPSWDRVIFGAHLQWSHVRLCMCRSRVVCENCSRISYVLRFPPSLPLPSLSRLSPLSPRRRAARLVSATIFAARHPLGPHAMLTPFCWMGPWSRSRSKHIWKTLRTT